MRFDKAFKIMKQGSKVKLPSWGGYWFWSKEKQTIIMHTKDGEELDIRETQIPDYTFGNICSDEWVLADGENCPELGGEATFSFGEAIKYLKRGMKVARKLAIRRCQRLYQLKSWEVLSVHLLTWQKSDLRILQHLWICCLQL